MRKYIYKICTTKEWKIFKKKKEFNGGKLDILDGYIHFSSKNQVKSTLKRHFLKKDNLILLKVKIFNLKRLTWEKSKKNIIFPHLYSHLKIKNIKDVYAVSLKRNGLHSISKKKLI